MKRVAEGHVSRNEFAEAEKLLREFIACKADSVVALNLLAYVLEKQDRQEEAEKIRRQAKDLGAPPAPPPQSRPPAPVEETPAVTDGSPASIEEEIPADSRTRRA